MLKIKRVNMRRRQIPVLVHLMRILIRLRRNLPSVVEGVRQFGGRQGLGETLFEMYRF